MNTSNNTLESVINDAIDSLKDDLRKHSGTIKLFTDDWFNVKVDDDVKINFNVEPKMQEEYTITYF